MIGLLDFFFFFFFLGVFRGLRSLMMVVHEK